MTREVIGRWPLVVEVETVEARFKIDVKECDERILTVRQMPHPHPGEVRHYRGGSDVILGTGYWPTCRLPGFRAAVEQLVEELRAEHAPPAEEIDLCGLKACEDGCGRPKPSHRTAFGLGQCYWCSPAHSTMLCDADDCARGIDGRSHPYCEPCQRKHATGRSPEADAVKSARTTSPGRPGERPTYCALCGERTPCGDREHEAIAYQEPADKFDSAWPVRVSNAERDTWHAEHNPTERPPSDHEMEHVSVRGPADEEPKPETTCTAWGCLRPRDRERLYCDPCGGRLTSADVDPHHLTQWPPREDEPEEELRVTGESIPMASSVRDAAQQSFERHRLIGESVDVAADLYAHLDVYDLAAARREYARLGELLRELEGS